MKTASGLPVNDALIDQRSVCGIHFQARTRVVNRKEQPQASIGRPIPRIAPGVEGTDRAQTTAICGNQRERSDALLNLTNIAHIDEGDHASIGRSAHAGDSCVRVGDDRLRHSAGRSYPIDTCAVAGVLDVRQ